MLFDDEEEWRECDSGLDQLIIKLLIHFKLQESLDENVEGNKGYWLAVRAAAAAAADFRLIGT